MRNIPSKQQGFTLLELLVVITLLAVLAVGALVAYEDVGSNAEAAAAANTNVTIDQAIRTYRSVTGDYPNQWDSLILSTAASAIPGLPTDAKAVLGPWQMTTTVSAALTSAFEEVGIDELQYLTNATQPANIPPNRRHNESVNTGNAQEFAIWNDVTNAPAAANFRFAVVPNADCDAGDTGTFGTVFSGTNPTGNEIQNRFNDSLESDECHLVIALGFGSDAAASTTSSNVAIAQAPTYVRQGSVNPNTDYARYIGLFHVAADGNNNDAIEAGEFFDRARLIGVITTDGRTIDDSIAAAQTAAN